MFVRYEKNKILKAGEKRGHDDLLHRVIMKYLQKPAKTYY